ncbi:MAG: hypothetical protein IPJ01_10115 [Micavibrio sp.]|nr:hypothetical protein [Micavibrio sp.]
MKKNILTQLFFDALKKAQETGSIYLHLFSMLAPDKLEEELLYLFNLSEGNDDYFKEDGKENWFFIFHKSIRQTDFFEGCFKKSNFELITEVEEKEFRFLNNKVQTKAYNKKSENGKLFSDEYSRYLNLWERRRRQNKEDSINGHLDSVLWNVIHLDKGELTKAFKRAFNEYKLELEEVSIKSN